MRGEVAGVWLLCCKSRKKPSADLTDDVALVPALFEKGDLPGEKRVADLVGS